MISRELGVIHMALIDAIHAQHPIIGPNDERPVKAQFAQWVRGGQGTQLGVSGVLDLGKLSMDLKARMDSIAERPDASRDAEWAALDIEAALSAPQSAEPEPDDPFPPPTPENPGDADTAPRCQHCGMFIERTGTGRGWRHTGTRFLGCEPKHETLAEP